MYFVTLIYIHVPNTVCVLLYQIPASSVGSRTVRECKILMFQDD